MTQQRSRFRLTHVVRAAYEGDAPAWLRVLLLAGALILGALAYHQHIVSLTVWGAWVAELLAGCVLLILALHDGRPPAEAALRRWARRSMWLMLVAATAVAIRLVPQPGYEVWAAGAVGVGVLAFFLARWVPFAPEDVE